MAVARRRTETREGPAVAGRSRPRMGIVLFVLVLWLILGVVLAMLVAPSLDQPPFWLSFLVFFVLSLVVVMSWDPYSPDPQWVYPIKLSRPQSRMLRVTAMTIVVALVVFLNLSYPRSLKLDVLGGACSGFLAGLACGLTYLEFIRKPP